MNTSTSNTASHDKREKMNLWVSFSLLYEYGSSDRNSTININNININVVKFVISHSVSKREYQGVGVLVETILQVEQQAIEPSLSDEYTLDYHPRKEDLKIFWSLRNKYSN